MNKIIACIFSFFLLLASCKVSKKPVPPPLPQKTGSGNAKADSQKEFSEFLEAEKARILGENTLALKLYNDYLSKYSHNATAYYNTARLLFKKQDINNATKNAEKATRIDPDNKYFQEFYIQLLVYSKNIKQAESQFNTLINKNPDNDEYIYKKAMLYLTAKDYEKAIETFSELEKKVGYSEDIILKKKSLYQQLNKTDLAIAELKKLRDAEPSAVQYTIMMIDVYETGSQKEKANAMYRELETRYPDEPLAQVALAQYYLENKNKQQYNVFMQKVMKNRNLDAETKLGLIIPSLSDTAVEKDQIVEMVRSIARESPENKKVAEMYADVLYFEKKYDEALAECKRYLQNDKSNFEIWNKVISIYTDMQQYDSVLVYGNKCIEYFPNNPMPYFFLGIAHLQMKEAGKALSPLNKAADLEPENPLLYSQIFASLGEAYNAIKDYNKSDSCFERALKIQPNDASTLNNFAYYLSLRKNRLEEAEVMSKKSLELQPDSKSFLDTYGWILFQQGKYADAKLYIEKAIKAGGEEDGTLYEHLGDIYFKLNDTSKAKENWNKAKEKGESNPVLNKKVKEGVWYEE